MSERVIIAMAGIWGFLGVAFGAFGAHGLRSRLEGVENAAERLGWWETGARYHLMHALAIAFSAWLASRGTGLGARSAAVCFSLGIAIFSGTLYAMALGAPRWLGAITPIGGAALLAGWACVVWAGFRP